MRAEQWLMIAVGGLGAYAIYRLVTNKPAETKREDVPVYRSEDQPVPPPLPPLPSGDLVQNILGRNAPAGSALLRTNSPYRGRLELAPTATWGDVASKLTAIGFGDVKIYMNLSEAQSGDAIPLPGALVNPTAGSRWFHAVWRGPSGARALPRELVLLWPTVTIPRMPTTAGLYAWPTPASLHASSFTAFAG